MTQDQLRGALCGLLVGDALGVPFDHAARQVAAARTIGNDAARELAARPPSAGRHLIG